MERPTFDKTSFIQHIFKTFSDSNGDIDLQAKFIQACLSDGSIDYEFITPLLRPVIQLPDYLDFTDYGETVAEFIFVMLNSQPFLDASEKLSELFNGEEARYVCNAFINIPRKTHILYKGVVEYMFKKGDLTETKINYLILTKVLNEYAKSMYGISSNSGF